MMDSCTTPGGCGGCGVLGDPGVDMLANAETMVQRKISVRRALAYQWLVRS